MEGFIVLHRKMLEWEWADDPGTVSLWIHLLLRANHEKGKWRGIVIKRGQLVTSVESLSLQTGLTKKQIRTRLDRLVESGCLGKQTANNYTLLTICKYGDYQDIPNNEGKQKANKRQTKGKQRATNNNENNNNNIIPHTKCAREEEFFDEAFRNESWRETIRMRHKLSEAQESLLWEEFKLHSRASNKEHDSVRDVQEHFNLWILSRNNKHGTDNRDYNSDEARQARREGAAHVMRQLYENGKLSYEEVPDP